MEVFVGLSFSEQTSYLGKPLSLFQVLTQYEVGDEKDEENDVNNVDYYGNDSNIDDNDNDDENDNENENNGENNSKDDTDDDTNDIDVVDDDNDHDQAMALLKMISYAELVFNPKNLKRFF